MSRSYKEVTAEELVPGKVYYDQIDGEKLRYVKKTNRYIAFAEVPKDRYTMFLKDGKGLILFPLDMIFYRLSCIVILLSLFMSANCQLYNKHPYAEPVKTIGIFSASIILNAAGDALKDSGHKPLGHTLDAASYAALGSSIILLNPNKRNWFTYLATYTLLRIALFDVTYNLTRHLPIDYVGNTCAWDKMRQKQSGWWQVQGFSLGLGIAIPLGQLNTKQRR
jgi:hypothetical protein